MASTRIALVVALLGLIGAGAALAQGGDPRREQERLTAADNALAKRIAVRRADLGSGWKGVRPEKEDDDEPFTCPGYNPDFSAFTITGKAQSQFEHTDGVSLMSFVEVYESRSDAIGDFRLGAKPALARCLRLVLEDELKKERNTTVKITVVSARSLRAPRVGERAAAWRIVARVATGGVTAPIYLDVLAFQKARAITALLFVTPFRPFPGQAVLARRLAERVP